MCAGQLFFGAIGCIFIITFLNKLAEFHVAIAFSRPFMPLLFSLLRAWVRDVAGQLDFCVMTNVLFVCSSNQWRSSTAETLWQRRAGLKVRSAGTDRDARHPVSTNDIQWADVILVMEAKHKTLLCDDFDGLLNGKRISVLGVPRDYRYMDPELVAILENSVSSALAL